MFTLPNVYVLGLFLFVSGVVFVSGVICALLLNCLLKTTRGQYLLSSGFVAVAGYFITTAILLYALPPLHWVNERPQDLRTALWDHLPILVAVVAMLCLALWQYTVRAARRRRLMPLRRV